jgi:hypothetical protein
MSKRPALAQYPHLRQILKNDPVANQQFNQAIAGISGSFVDNSNSSALNAARLQERMTKLAEELADLRAMFRVQQMVITLLGEVIEPQTHLRPYTQDLAEAGTYEIKFTATQIREALRLHWELMAQQAEATIRGDVPAVDSDDENM